jgi:hypothetical protein
VKKDHYANPLVASRVAAGGGLRTAWTTCTTKRADAALRWLAWLFSPEQAPGRGLAVRVLGETLPGKRGAVINVLSRAEDPTTTRFLSRSAFAGRHNGQAQACLVPLEVDAARQPAAPGAVAFSPIFQRLLVGHNRGVARETTTSSPP